MPDRCQIFCGARSGGRAARGAWEVHGFSRRAAGAGKHALSLGHSHTPRCVAVERIVNLKFVCLARLQRSSFDPQRSTAPGDLTGCGGGGSRRVQGLWTRSQKRVHRPCTLRLPPPPQISDREIARSSAPLRVKTALRCSFEPIKPARHTNFRFTILSTATQRGVWECPRERARSVVEILVLGSSKIHFLLVLRRRKKWDIMLGLWFVLVRQA